VGHYNLSSIVTGYRLDCLGSNSSGDKIFDTCLYTSGYSSSGIHLHLAQRFKERVELYAYSTSGPS